MADDELADLERAEERAWSTYRLAYPSEQRAAHDAWLDAANAYALAYRIALARRDG